MKSTILLLIVLSLTNCSTKRHLNGLKPSSFPDNCNHDLISKVREFWSPYGETKCHPYDEFSGSFISKYKSCFIGEDKTLVTKLLGEPTYQSAGKYSYLLSQDCRIFEQGTKHYLNFLLDSTSTKVIDMVMTSAKWMQ